MLNQPTLELATENQIHKEFYVILLEVPRICMQYLITQP